MPDKLTISEAARVTLEKLGRPSSIHEIYEEIIALALYRFNTDVPEHVLRTEIRRKTEGVERVDSSDDAFFRLAGDEIYELIKEPTKRRSTIGMKRIHRAGDKEEIIKLLTSDSVGAFREIWRLMLFAATLGFKHARREKLVSVEAGKGIDQSSFGNNPVWPGILYLLGLAETDATDALKATEEAEDERITIFEEYANGGLALLKEQFAAKSLSLDALLNFVQAESAPATNQTPDLQITI